MNSVDALVIDARLLQTSTWSRGMGRYMLGIIQGLAEQLRQPRVMLLFGEEFGVDDSRVGAIHRANPHAEIVTLPILKGRADRIRQGNAKIVDEFLKNEGLSNVIFLQASIFTFDYFPFYPGSTFNTCIFYDMIPIKLWSMFVSFFPGYEYFSRFKALYEADKIFSISNTVKNDLMEYLGFNEVDVINIDGASVPDIYHEAITVSHTRPREYRYVLLPGGDAPHKNMLRAIRGFDIFNAQFGDIYKLIITSFYSKENERRMFEMSPNIELTGQVSDEGLRNLYAHAEMVLFPSLDEGLGLPILEAVNYGKKVVCSDIPIFKELSGEAFYYFDPFNPQEIADALSAALADKDDQALQAKYECINDRFTWSKSVAALLSVQLVKEPSRSRGASGCSIVVEQDGSAQLTQTIGRIVRTHYKSQGVNMFVNILDTQLDATAFPLIFNHMLPTRDISDVIKKSAKQRIVIYTNQSYLSRAMQKPSDDVIYIGTDKEKVEKNFYDHFGVSE